MSGEITVNVGGAPCEGFWHIQSAKSMHEGTSNCGMTRAGSLPRALRCYIMLLPLIHALQSPHAFGQLRPSPALYLYSES